MEKGKRCAPITRGQATLFGFKKPSNIQSNGGGTGGRANPTQPSLPSVPASIVQETIEPLVIAPVQPRQGTPKLSRAKKDGARVANRFGFRPPTSMSNKVADLQQSDSRSESDFRQSSRPHSVPALKLAGGRSISETRYNSNRSANSATTRSCNSTELNQQQKTSKYSLQTTNLPQAQNVYYRPVQSSAAVVSYNGGNSTSLMTDKWAKTKANNQRAAQGKQMHSATASNASSQSSPTDSESGTQKSFTNDSVLEIQQLEHSPNLGHKYRNLQQQKTSRPMEMVFTDSRTKRFELRDLTTQIRPGAMSSSAVGIDGNSMISSRAELVQPTMSSTSSLQQSYTITSSGSSTSNNCQTPRATSSSSADEGFDEVSNGEEKQNRDKLSSEKVRLGSSPDDVAANMDGDDEETLWGRGEAMALDDQIPHADIADIDQSPESITPRLRSVLLTIEDPEFTSLAVMSHSTSMLEDEVSPESPDLSCSSPSSVEPLPPPPNLVETPGSPETPTHATNSLSSDAKDRDFLIDDEIADQPGLIFDTQDRHRLRHDSAIKHSSDDIDLLAAMAADDTSILDTSRTISKLAGEVSQVLASMNAAQQPTLQYNARTSRQQCASITSLNTLSPCESLASDDLIGDYDRSDISAALDDLNELDDVPLKSEILTQSDQVIKEWSSLLSTHPGLSNGTTRTPSKPIRPRMRTISGSSGSPSNIPTLQNRVQVNNTLGDDISIDSGIKVDRDKLEQMAQEVISIKSMLLKLKKVLEEAETINPLDGSFNNSLYAGLAASEATAAAGEGATTPPQLADLQRQIVLLSAQLEERDSRIVRLEDALKRSNEARPLPQINININRTNVATQTDRIRPLSTGPTLFQTSPDNTTTSFISMNDRTTPISCQVISMNNCNKKNSIRATATSQLKQSYNK